MSRELAAAREEGHRLQGLWVARQGELVGLARSSAAAGADVTRLRGSVAVLQRKRARLESQCAAPWSPRSYFGCRTARSGCACITPMAVPKH